MKKTIFIIYIILLTITGCSLSNSPNAKVEELLNKYQKLDKSIIISPNILAKDNNLDNNLEKEYANIIKKQYRNLEYEIKNTIEDGNTAKVTTKIKVLDYKNIINKVNNTKDNFMHNQIIKELKETKKKVTYTIEITLSKNEKGKWTVNNLSNEIENKILGIY